MAALASLGRSCLSTWFRSRHFIFPGCVLVMGISFVSRRWTASIEKLIRSIEPGSAVSDLQALDKNHDLYSDFDVLDDLEVQENVTANP